MIDFAAATLPSEATSASPFLIDCGYEPRTSFDWTPLAANLPRDEKISRERAQESAQKMQNIWETVKSNLQETQHQYRVTANQHRQESPFQVGDKVWLSLKNYSTDQPNKKLDNQQEGPFPIIEQVGHAYRLQLPDGMNIHPVFSPDKLRLAANNPLPGQIQEPPGPIQVNDDREWEVEKVLNSRLYRKCLQYRVKWLGYDEDRTWYPARNFKGSPHRLCDFHDEYPNRPGPPKQLKRWLAAWEEDEDLEDRDDDDLPQA